MFRSFVCLALFVPLLAPSFAVADDWPQWMGPERDGVYREPGVIDRIPEAGLPVRWRTPIGGGYAGPAVAGGRVFVTDYVVTAGEPTNDPNQRTAVEGTERVLCLDAESGEVLWKHAYERPYNISYPSGPRCTPTVDGEHVYALGAEGDLRCLDVETGELVWAKNFPQDFGAETPLWGFAAHPLVDGPRLVCMVGGEGQTVVALDKQTGEEIWRALSASEVGYCPPSIFEAGGVRQLVVWHADALESLDPEDGSVYWSVPLKPNFGMAIAKPQREGDLLYASGIGNISVMLRLESERPEVTELWRGDARTSVYCSNSTPIIADGVIYGTDSRIGALIACDVRDGRRLWQSFQPTRPDEQRRLGHGTAFITRHEDQFFLMSEIGDLILARLSADGYDERGRFHILEPTSEAFGRAVVWSHPAYANRHVYARNDKEIVAVGIGRNREQGTGNTEEPSQ